MQDFPSHTPETAPADARPLLEDARRQYGMVPNLYAKMAEAPALLQAYQQIAELFARSGLDPTEQQVVLLTVSRMNDCAYCMGAHGVLADAAGVPAEVVTDAIRLEPVHDARLEALRRFTARLVETRGWLDDADIPAFLSDAAEAEDVAFQALQTVGAEIPPVPMLMTMRALWTRMRRATFIVCTPPSRSAASCDGC